ncbi:MAG: DNA-directed RNA polymerase subunit N, partial [Candidatus Aenigmarchaeota archaeon]|nr:DNA-directed RNA polymerase subunit N [Candidatus Aenigmarchaeota archaeon]
PAEVMDSLGIKRYCCRTIFLTHVDLIKEVARFKV